MSLANWFWGQGALRLWYVLLYLMLRAGLVAPTLGAFPLKARGQASGLNSRRTCVG